MNTIQSSIVENPFKEQRIQTLTDVILDPIKEYVASLPPHIKAKALPLLNFQEESIFNSDLERYIKIKMGRKGIPYSPDSFIALDIYNDIVAHILGYSGKMKNPKTFATYWINSFKEGIKKEAKDLPLVIKFFSTTVSKALSRACRDNFLLTETFKTNDEGETTISFSSLDKSASSTEELDLYEVIADTHTPLDSRMNSFLESSLELLDRDTIPAEMLSLFLNGVSKRDMIYHIRKFGVNGKGGTHSHDPQVICKVDHFYFNEKRQMKQPLTPKLMLASTEPINVVFEPRYASLNPQLIAYYLKRIKEYIHSLWNSFEAQTTEEMIDEDNQAGTQFLNWEVPACNKYAKDRYYEDKSYFDKEELAC